MESLPQFLYPNAIPLPTPCFNVALNSGVRASSIWINIENGERGKSLVITLQWSNTFGPDCSLAKNLKPLVIAVQWTHWGSDNKFFFSIAEVPGMKVKSVAYISDMSISKIAYYIFIYNYLSISRPHAGETSHLDRICNRASFPFPCRVYDQSQESVQEEINC